MTGHRCSCDCAAARERAQIRFRAQILLYRLAGLWAFVSFVCSNVLYTYVIPASWVGSWVWLPVLATWGVVTVGPAWVFRRWARQRSTAPVVVAS